jgi:hypothetical protein
MEQPPVAVAPPVAPSQPVVPPPAALLQPEVAAASSVEQEVVATPSVEQEIVATPSVEQEIVATPSVEQEVVAEPSRERALVAGSLPNPQALVEVESPTVAAAAGIAESPVDAAAVAASVESAAIVASPIAEASGPVVASEAVARPRPPALPQPTVEPLPTAEPLPAARPAISSRISELPSSLSLPPPLAGLGARVINSIPPHWLVIARRHPASWMVGAPVAVASLLILGLLVAEPARTTPAPAVTRAAASLPTLETAPAAPPPTGEAKPAPETLKALEAKPADTLSVAELLLLNEGRAQQKRADAEALSQKLQQQPALANDESVQAQLWRLALDPDTAAIALGAMARAPAPVGADLLYEVWTSRAVSPGTVELARSLLFSHAVRQNASPALAVALDLRNADNCDAIQAALPKASSDGDRRSLSALAKLNSHRACTAKTMGDCNPCLSGPVKPVVAAVMAAKRRPGPHYPTR